MPTPTDVRNVSLTGVFASLTDEQIQRFLDCVTPWFSSEVVIGHSQRDEVITYMTAHAIWVQLKAEQASAGTGVIAVGGLSSVRLDGVGSKSYAVAALQPANFSDLLKTWSPFVGKLGWLIDTLPPGLTTVGTGANGTMISIPRL